MWCWISFLLYICIIYISMFVRSNCVKQSFEKEKEHQIFIQSQMNGLHTEQRSWASTRSFQKGPWLPSDSPHSQSLVCSAESWAPEMFRLLTPPQTQPVASYSAPSWLGCFLGWGCYRGSLTLFFLMKDAGTGSPWSLLLFIKSPSERKFHLLLPLCSVCRNDETGHNQRKWVLNVKQRWSNKQIILVLLAVNKWPNRHWNNHHPYLIMNMLQSFITSVCDVTHLDVICISL